MDVYVGLNEDNQDNRLILHLPEHGNLRVDLSPLVAKLQREIEKWEGLQRDKPQPDGSS